MTTAYEITLTPIAQDFTIALAGTVYTLTVFWNRAAASWMLNIGDAQGAPIVYGIPMVTGTDLLRQYGYLGIGGSLIVQTDYAVDNIPTIDNLGADSHLYFVVG